MQLKPRHQKSEVIFIYTCSMTVLVLFSEDYRTSNSRILAAGTATTLKRLSQFR
jgi:hypothetical protein